ncbi:hypothetical protein HRbin08_00365 [bacterium HR08]|nr:hypothetical protein HRbin08_00365 [bacterium HR08]
MARRHADGWARARRDLKAVRDSRGCECFQAQQAAEKALKAPLRPWNHSLSCFSALMSAGTISKRSPTIP